MVETARRIQTVTVSEIEQNIKTQTHVRTHLILVLGGGRTIKQVGNLEQLAHSETVGAVQLRDLELDLRLVDLRASKGEYSSQREDEILETIWIKSM